MTGGKFYVDSENFSPQVKRGHDIIWSENNPSYDGQSFVLTQKFKATRIVELTVTLEI